jgi:F-type H+-transporting ATPase subunit delta
MADVSKNARIKSVLQDPSALAIARVYSMAFMNAAADEAGELIEELESFVTDVLQSNPQFESMMVTGLMNRDQKAEMIDRVIEGRASEFFASFLSVLTRHDRLDLLPVIVESVKLENEKRNNQQRVQVVSAQELSGDALEDVKTKLTAAFDFEPIVETQTDAKLIGGLVIRVGNSVYDGSLRSRLNQLAKRMQQGSLHEIQSGRDRFSNPEGD